MEKLLSIIIATYNMEDYLRRCLDSLLVKEYVERMEVWIVNDGSTDSSPDIAHEYADRHPGIFHVIDKENGHYGSCINAALPRCTGKYVRLLDADDYFDRDGIVQLMGKLESTNVDAILLDYVEIKGDRKTHFSHKYADGQVFDLDKEIPIMIVMHNVIYKTEVFSRFSYRQTEGIPYTDLEWSLYPVLYCKDLQFFNIELYQYILGRKGQTMETDIYIENIPNHIRIVESMVKWRSEMMPTLSESRRVFLSSILELHIRMICKNELLYIDKKKVHRKDLKRLDNLIATCDPDYHKRFTRFSKINLLQGLLFYRMGWILPNCLRKIPLSMKYLYHEYKGWRKHWYGY